MVNPSNFELGSIVENVLPELLVMLHPDFVFLVTWSTLLLATKAQVCQEKFIAVASLTGRLLISPILTRSSLILFLED